jgi:5-oxoprolinase (ATP-hydrolysing) subunit A
MKIDLNCDMGESFGKYELGQDEAVMASITSANIACGLHAGDPVVMDRTVRLAARYGVRVGAHPGYPDLQGFGRRAMDLSLEEAEAFTLYQISALAGIAKTCGVELSHVKPHGALYNESARDPKLAGAIARAVKRFSGGLVLVGLAGSALIDAGREVGLRVANEGFPDRVYNEDGTLRSRRETGALMGSIEAISAQAVRLSVEGISFGAGKPVRVDTLCLHGDHPGAAENARAVRKALQEAGVEIKSL